ncbi:MAG: hypothetical protein KC649_03435, partial [Candidatus Omnitrophica bacterium]|nr:hypothetical protein [Candidatus Omnitrophota bacterium]
RDGQTVQARTVYSYNASGQTLEVQNYTYSSDSDSLVLTSKTVYEYYSNGRTQFVRSYSLNSSGNEVLTSEIEYYDTGRTKRSTSFNSSTGNKTYEYYYDENGRYQGNAYFDGDGNIRSKSEYVYDQDGRTKEIINSSVVDGELTVTQKTKYAYHSNGRNRQIISVKVLADGTEQLLSKTEYNSDGRTVLQESYNSSTGLISYRYTYDDSGNQTGYVRYDSEGNENYSVSYTYNESGKITEQVVKSVSGGVYGVTQRTAYHYYPNDKYYEVKTFSVKPDGSEVLTQHNEYFDTGRTKMQTVFNSTTGNRSYKYEYNYNGSTNFYERYESDGVTVNFRQDYDYDNLNRLTRLSEKSLVDGVLTLTYITDRTYYSNDQLKDTRRYKVLSDGALLLVQLIEYQSGGRIQQQVIYSESNGSMQTRYLYDENGRQISYERFDAEGNAVSKQTYSYNANGQRTSIGYYTLVDGILTETSRNEYEYNADGQLTKQSGYSMVSGELKLTSWTEYKYDGNYYSEIISYKQNYDSDGNPAGDPVKLSSTVYYPGSNLVKERINYREDGTKSTSSLYNLSGQLTQSEQFDATGTKKVSKTDYEYDASGLQIRKTTHSLVDDVLVPTAQTRYEYNTEGKRTLIEEYSRIGNRLRKTSWTVYEYSGSYYSKIQSFIQNYDSDGNPLGDPITTSLTNYHDGSNTVKDRTYFTNQGVKTYRYTYNTSGRNVMYERFDATGENVINKTEYEYDDRGRTTRVSNSALVNGELKIVSWSENAYDGDYPTVSESFVQHYDADGNATDAVKTNQTLYHPNSSTVRERSYYNSTTGIINRKYEYTTDSLLDTDTSYDSAGNPSSQRKHHYDQNKRLIRIEDFIFNQTGTKVKVGETRYEYAANGRYSKVSTFRMIDGELVLSASTEYEYDSNGRQTKVTNSAVVDGEFRKTNETTYEYDENGRIQRQQNFQFVKDSEGNLIRKLQSEYLYDSLTGTLSKYKIYNVLTGQLVKEYTYNSNGRLLENVTYDSNGNRVSEVFNTYSGNQLTKVETYTYY